MSTSTQRHDYTPPPPDEGYWAALLQEGEFSEAIPEETEDEGDAVAVSGELHDDQAVMDYAASPNQTDWAEMTRIYEHDEVLELPVIGFNRGGLLVEWRSLRGFVPASQLDDFAVNENGFARRDALKDYVGKILSLRIIELYIEQNRLILSERAARVMAGQRADLLHQLAPGDIVTGTVTNLCDFGAFVDLGGLEGLIHISELSWGRVGHPTDLLERNMHIQVYVMDVDQSAERIALSLKRLHPDPWETVAERYTVGQMITGVITNVVDFGAFACIEEGLEGLIHVSELAEGHFLHPRNVVNEGQTVEARVLSIDSRGRRLGLSLRLEK
ncbi:MAG: S1 RNA-binding domain-containing protein [Anaerolineaceae bacterium]|nr:S1 RNA-binding domain-containing protein [Anaerolineaceae bacterium]